MKKSLSIETMFSDVPFYERFAKVREAGFNYVEFDDWTELVFSRVTELLSRYSLKLACISGTQNHSLLDTERHEDFLEYLSQTIAVSKNFACPNIIIASEADVRDSVRSGKDGKNDFAKISAATRVLTDAAAMAAKAGVTLLIKSTGRPTPDRCIPCAGNVVKMVNSPTLRILYEAKRGERFNDGAVAALRKFRDVIHYVHVIDDRSYPENALPGLGNIRTVLTYELGYNGFVGFKLHTGGDVAGRLDEIGDF